MSGSILYLGGSYPQKIAVRSLVEAGFEVHVTDRTTTPACAAETPHIHQVDATDTDAILALAASLQTKGGFLGAYGIADYAFKSVAAVSRLIGGRMSAPDTLETMIDKAATKACLADAAVPQPQTLWTGPLERFALETPDVWHSGGGDVIVKPATENASAGISRVSSTNKAELGIAVSAAALNGDNVVIEEFFDGEIRNLDVLVIDGEVVPISITRRKADPNLEFLPALQYQFAKSADPEFAALSGMAHDIARALGCRSGPFTVDYIASAGGPKVLEVSPHFHSIALEIQRGNGNPLRAWCRYLRGDRDWADDLAAPDEQSGALIMLRADQTGYFGGFKNELIFDDSPSIVDHVQMKQRGARIESLSARDGLVAVAWMTAPSRQALESGAEQMLADAKPIIEPSPVAA